VLRTRRAPSGGRKYPQPYCGGENKDSSDVAGGGTDSLAARVGVKNQQVSRAAQGKVEPDRPDTRIKNETYRQHKAAKPGNNSQEAAWLIQHHS